MPSPFPGMDPYLEHPALWTGVHQSLITYLRDELQPGLGRRYFAQIGERLYVASSERGIYPDVAVLAPPGKGLRAVAAQAEVDDPVVLTLEPEEVREAFLEIVDLEAGQRVVTIIEVLSPANKQAGTAGHDLYRRKQAEVLQSQTHLVEIDLLRDGSHTVAIPPDGLVGRRPFHYLVCIARADDRGRREVYPIHLRQRLPRIRIPLLAPDPDAVVDLQALLAKTYDNGAYGRRLDYRRPPAPALAIGDEDWCRSLTVGADSR